MIAIFVLALTLPLAHLTPGAVRTTQTADVCPHAGTAAIRRGLTAATKREVFRRYHVTPRAGAYEIDHLVSLELGGSNDVANLWPQAYRGRFNAHDKDRLENQLHALVCRGALTLADAQRAIATDWIAALQTYGGRGGPR